MLGSDAILRALEHEGVDVAFGIPGGAILPTYDALARGTTVRHVLARHEQGAGHMAEGYARASGKVGVAIATSGPGATNLVTAIADAWMDSTPVVFITGHADIPMAVEAMRHGAFDFLQKPFRDQDLIDCTQEALRHDQQTRGALREHARIRARVASLTPREREVLDLLAAGKANKTMAQDLGLSPRTVEIHRTHVMEKMAAKSVAQLVRMVMELEQRDVAA